MTETVCFPEDLAAIREKKGRARLSYRKTYNFDGDVIDGAHAGWISAPLADNQVSIIHRRTGRSGWVGKVMRWLTLRPRSIPGSLRREDAAKLYEMAYFAKGDVLELGTNRGLSAFVMASAIGRTGRKLDTIELDSFQCKKARKNLADFKNVTVHCREAAAWLDSAIADKRRFGFAFVDHSHRGKDVLAASQRMSRLLSPGAFIAFHDFNDYRNYSGDSDYGVLSGAIDGLGRDFVFCGGFGCVGLFQYRPGQAANG